MTGRVVEIIERCFFQTEGFFKHLRGNLARFVDVGMVVGASGQVLAPQSEASKLLQITDSRRQAGKWVAIEIELSKFCQIFDSPRHGAELIATQVEHLKPRQIALPVLPRIGGISRQPCNGNVMSVGGDQ